MTKTQKIKEVAGVFFKLGCFAFGGPAAHVAMMEDELVRKRQWMSRQHFLDLMGATNLIPGPNSTEMTMHCGHERAGKAGLFVAGICFIFPAVVITAILAWIYVTYGNLPEIAPFITGIKPAVLAIIAHAIIKLGKKALKNWLLGIIGIAVVTLSLFNFNEVLVLLGAGALGALFFSYKNSIRKTTNTFAPLALIAAFSNGATAIGTSKIFLSFLKVGSILYGSGYVLFAYLDGELVEKGLLSTKDLLDAIAIGQFTPGPVLSTATFIGFQMNGISGALAATAGIFLPSFLFVLILNPLIPKMRQSRFLGHFLDSVNIAAVGIMVAVLSTMSYNTMVDWKTAVILAVSLFLTFFVKQTGVVWTVIIGGFLGYLLSLI